MFQPQTMSKVNLIVPEHDVVAVTEVLAASNVFHVAQTEPFVSESSQHHTNPWYERATTFTALEQRILAVMKALEINEGSPPSQILHLISPEVAQMEVEHLEEESDAALQELEAAQHKLAQLRRYHSQLEPIADLDVDLDDLRNMQYTFVLLGTIPVTNIERLKNSLEHIPFVLVTLRQQEHLATVILFGMQRDAEILNRAARSAYLNPLNPPEMYRGTPAAAIEALKAGITRTQQHIDESQANIKQLLKLHIRHLRHLLWRVRASRTLVETIAGYEHLRYTYLATGWVPTADIQVLKQKIARVSEKVTIETTEFPQMAPREKIDEEEFSQVPVTLKNPPLIRAFQGLVTNYGYPKYGELDPTPVLAMSFPLIFGLMFGDVGHGLFLALLGLIITSGKIKSLKALSSLGGIILGCGIFSAVFGILYGSVFGFETLLQPLWLRPLEDITDILLVTVGIGTVVLSIGMLCNTVNAFLAKRWGLMLFNHNSLAGLIFYWSLIGIAVKAFGVAIPLNTWILAILALVSGLGLTFSELLEHLLDGEKPLIEGSTSTYLMQALFELFETLIGFLSNTLSYVRMGAFAVAHGAISMVVFIMAEIISPTHSIGYWLTIVLGNLFIIGFEGMIVGIQTLRLEYYEFFSKFFSGSGKRYKPLTLLPNGEN